MSYDPNAPQPYQPPRRDPRLDEAHSKKILCGLLALFLGNLGIHKFILGYNGTGVLMLLINLTCIGAPVIRIISIVEGIIYLTKSDEDFYNIYMANRKDWF